MLAFTHQSTLEARREIDRECGHRRLTGFVVRCLDIRCLDIHCSGNLLYLARIAVDFPHTGQKLRGRLTKDGSAVSTIEASHQAQSAIRTAHQVPRNPNAVGIAEASRTMMRGKLFWRDDKFFQRYGLGGTRLVTVKHINSERTLDFDRVVFLIPIEVESSAKPSDCWLGWLVENCVGPNR